MNSIIPRIPCETKRLESLALPENEQKRSLMLSAESLETNESGFVQ